MTGTNAAPGAPAARDTLLPASPLATGDDLARFASVVSHDFSAPLRTIRGFAGILADDFHEDPGDVQAGYLAEIIDASSRMQRLNDGLVACLRARSSVLDLGDVSLDATVRRLEGTFGPRIAEQDATLTASALPDVWADAGAIRTVLDHLVDNALRYAHPERKPAIAITATLAPGHWTVTVSDNGAGMTATNRERAFVLFKRVDAERHPESAGVGLTLCRTLIERHGGRVWLSAAPGGGTEAVFTIPFPPAPPGDARDPAPATTAEVIPAPVRMVQSLAAMAAIVEYSDDAIFSKDLDGLIITWNAAAERLYGYSAEEVLGKHVSLLMPPNRLQELPNLMKGVRAGERLHTETLRMGKAGNSIEVSLSVSPIRDLAGHIVGASVIARDITERHRTEDQLRAFLEVAPDAIVVIDEDGSISAVNAQAEKTFGYAPNELIGLPLEVLLPERFRSGHVAQRVGFASQPTRRPMGSGLELFALRRDGSEFPVDIQLSSLVTGDGGTRPVAAIRDVTERRRVEHLRDNFVRNAAHELRTPLTTLAGLAETLSQSFDVMPRSDIEQAFVAMARQGERARVLIANLLDLSDIEGDRGEFAMVNVTLLPLIERVLEAAPPPDGKTVEVRIAAALALVADPDRLEQVVTNLLVNAYRYGGTAISIDAVAERSRVILSVADSGAGVTAELSTTLFEPFTRGRVAGVVRGSGIGLALCRRIVERMGGEVWYDSRAGHGACFRVSLGCAT